MLRVRLQGNGFLFKTQNPHLRKDARCRRGMASITSRGSGAGILGNGGEEALKREGGKLRVNGKENK